MSELDASNDTERSNNIEILIGIQNRSKWKLWIKPNIKCVKMTLMSFRRATFLIMRIRALNY